MDWFQVLTQTEPIDQDKVLSLVKQLYGEFYLEEPAVIFAESPLDIILKGAEIYKNFADTLSITTSVAFDIPGASKREQTIEVGRPSMFTEIDEWLSAMLWRVPQVFGSMYH